MLPFLLRNQLPRARVGPIIARMDGSRRCTPLLFFQIGSVGEVQEGLQPLLERPQEGVAVVHCGEVWRGTQRVLGPPTSFFSGEGWRLCRQPSPEKRRSWGDAQRAPG